MNLLTLDAAMLAALARAPGIPPIPAGQGAGRIGVRPEALHLADAGVPAVVDAIEYMGADSIVLCDIAGQRIALRVAGAPEAAIGDTVHLRWGAEDVHLFDADGRRVAMSKLDRAA